MVRSSGLTRSGVDEPLQCSYRQALGAIREIFRQVDLGLVPETGDLLAAAQSLAFAAVREPAQLLGLTINKDCDSYNFHHSVNVGILAMALSAAMGHPLAEVGEAGLAGFLHDVGKTKIDREIVAKPGKLTKREYGEMKRHSEYGALLIRQMEGLPPRVANGVLGHHIRFDRGGYPEWARERAFGVMTGIVALADCYDATTTQRVYQPRMLPAQAVEEIRRQGGTGLDGEIVACFLELSGRFPVGSLVRLDSQETALVYTPSSDPRGAATVQLVRDSCGTPLAEPVLLSLAQSGSRIVDLVEPSL
jgi:putative nucleotidyltransferase with HDIG domain